MPARPTRPDKPKAEPRPKSSRIIAAPAPALKASTGAVDWAVYRLAAKAKYIGRVQAKDQKEALAKAYEEFAIPERERFKISVQRV